MADFPIKMQLRAVDKVSGALKRVGKNLNTLRGNVRRTTNSFKMMQRRTESLRKSITKVGTGMKSVGQKMTLGLTAPIAALGASALKTTHDFQMGMNRVAAKTGATSGQLAKMEKIARKLGSTTAFSAAEAADGMAFLAQAGFKTNAIMESITPTLHLAAAAEMELARAADIMSNVMGAFNMEQDLASSTRAADVLASITASANVDMEQLADTMKTAAPIANKFGVSLEETAAATGLLGNVGIQGTNAATALKNAFQNLAAPTSEAADVLRGLGVKVQDSQGNMLGFTQIMANFGKESKKITQADRLRAFKVMFGKQGIAGALALSDSAMRMVKDSSGNMVSEFELMTRKMNEAEGESKRMAGVLMKGLPGAFKTMLSAFDEMKIAITKDTGLGAFAEKFLGKMSEFFIWVSKLNPEFLKWSVIIAGVVAVAGPLLIALGGLVLMLPILITGWGLFVAALPAVIAGIAAVSAVAIKFGAVLWGVWQLTKPVFEFLAHAWDDPKNGALAFADVMTMGLVGKIMDHWEPLKGFFDSILGHINDAFNGAKKLVRKFASFLPDSINPFKTKKTPSGALGSGFLGANVGRFAAEKRIAPEFGAAKTISKFESKKEKSEVTIKLKNAPAGTRVEGSTPKNVNFVMGNQMAGAL